METNLYYDIMEYLKDSPELTILDGPLFTSDICLHSGTALISILKRILMFYNALKGVKMQNIQGIDAHGLQTEQAVLKEYGKVNIKLCKEYVTRCIDSWNYTFAALGRVRDNYQYCSMSNNYMESVWWSFAELYKKNLIYNGCYILPYSPACKTSLSNTEAAQYSRDIISTTYYIGFDSIENPGLKFLVWTTAGWTLPMNILIAINPNIIYCIVGGYIVAESCATTLFGSDCEKTIIGPGSMLVGQHYVPIFRYLSDQLPANDKNYTIVATDYVVADSTGLVHVAPCFNEDDFLTAKSVGYTDKDLLSICKLNDACEYLPLGLIDVELDFSLSGKCVTSEDVDNIIKNAIKRNCYKISSINHNHPYCERYRVPLINRIVNTILIDVDKIKDKILQKFEKTTWTPEGIKNGRFGKWLKNARNWNIGRNREFSTPIPLWKCEETEEYICISSIKELFELSGVLLDDLHKDSVSNVIIERDGKQFKHIQLVFDSWFESACAPVGKIHYPFENRTLIDDRADFIYDIVLEGADQTRGWFYNLLILNIALFDKLPYSHVICAGLVCDENGQKMSKSNGNYKDPLKYIEQYGPDAYSIYLASSPAASGDDLKFNEDDLAKIATHLNKWTVLMEYIECDADKHNSHNALDLWIIFKLNELEDKVNGFMKIYKINSAIRCAMEFIDILSNDYVQLSKLNGRIEEFLPTLRHVLTNYNIIMAPFAPFMAEKHHLALGGKRSVFFSRFQRLECEKDIYTDIAIKIINIVRQIRANNKEHVIIAKIYIGCDYILPDDMLEMIKAAVNCLIIESHEFSSESTYSIKFDYSKLGKKYGNKASFIKNYNYSQLILKQFYEKGSILLQQNLTLTVEDAIITREKKMPFVTEGLICEKSPCGNIIVCADFTKNARVIQDSIALDIISATQKILKEYNLGNVEIYYSGENLEIINTRMPNFVSKLKTKNIFIKEITNYTYYNSHSGTNIMIVKL